MVKSCMVNLVMTWISWNFSDSDHAHDTEIILAQKIEKDAYYIMFYEEQ